MKRETQISEITEKEVGIPVAFKTSSGVSSDTECALSCTRQSNILL